MGTLRDYMQMMKLIKKLIGVLTLPADAYKDKNGDYWLLDITFNNRFHYKRIEQNEFGFWIDGYVEVTLNSPMSESPLA